MVYTQADVDALKAAMATGALKVRYADGREVTYKDQAAQERQLGLMEAEVNPSAVAPRVSYAYYSRD